MHHTVNTFGFSVPLPFHVPLNTTPILIHDRACQRTVQLAPAQHPHESLYQASAAVMR
jgi:hypothetical protein